MVDYKSIDKVNFLKQKLLTKKLKNGQLWLYNELNGNNRIAHLIYSKLYIDLHHKKTKKYMTELSYYLISTDEEKNKTNLVMQDLLKKINNEIKYKEVND